MGENNKNEEKLVGYADPYYLAASDNPSMQISNMVFNGTNFINWSRSIRMSLGSKNKIGYIDGTYEEAARESKDRQKWLRNDYMVRSWLYKSMSEKLADSLMLCESARHLWEELCERYGESTAPQVYQLKRELNDLNQGDQSVSEYYCKMKSLCDEISYLESYPVCECEAKKACKCNINKRIIELMEKNKVMDFLMRLDLKKYQGVIGNILAMEPLPTLNRAYHLVLQAEKQKQIQESFQQLSQENMSAFNVGRVGKNNYEKREYKKDKLKKVCSHCGMKGHLMEECFKIVGYPDWFKGSRNKESTRYAANVYHNEIEDPLEVDDTKEEGSTSGSKVDVDVINSAVQGLIKALNLNRGERGNIKESSGFAGTITSSIVSKVFNVIDKNTWLIDSGASDHIGCNMSMFKNLKTLNNGYRIGLPDGTMKIVNHIGDIMLTEGLHLKNVLYVPDFKHNLLSLSRLLESKDMIIVFYKEGCLLQDPSSKRIYGQGQKVGGLYKLVLDEVRQRSEVGAEILAGAINKVGSDQKQYKTIDVKKMHVRLGHCSLSKLQHMHNCSISNLKHIFCDTCNLAKFHKLPFTLSNKIASDLFDLVHMDLWGPYKIVAVSGAKYFLTIVDDCSRVTWTHLISSKDQVKNVIQSFLSHVETQFNKRVKTVRSDNGTEFLNEECKGIFSDRGIVHQRSIPGVAQQNGRVERKHRHLIETARSLRLHASLPKSLWGECVLASTHIINLLPTAVLKWKTPYEVLFGTKPSYDHLKTIGCLCYGRDASRQFDKFDAKGVRSVLVGYPYAQKGYKLYDIERRKIFVSRDVVFQEDIFPFCGKEEFFTAIKLYPLENQEPIFVEDESTNSFHLQVPDVPSSPHGLSDSHADFRDEVVSPIHDASSPVESAEYDEGVDTRPVAEPQTLRRSNRARHVPEKFKDYQVSLLPCHGNHDSEEDVSLGSAVDILECDSSHFSTSLNNVMKVKEPHNYLEASRHAGWQQAMREELQALEKNSTWDLVELPHGKVPIGCKWVYKTKYRPDGSIERLKARLVARGDKQLAGKDYKHTFSPVAKFATVRILMAVASLQNWTLNQLDINNAFLHGTLDEEVYMKLPQGYYPDAPEKVCRLKKSLYGLKQASRQWNKALTKFLIDHGFVQSKRDYSLFVRKCQGKMCVVLAYVDDLLITGDDTDFVHTLKKELDAEFTIKDLGDMRFFLGIEVSRDDKGVTLRQQKFVRDLLEQVGMTSCKAAATPFPVGLKLTIDEGEELRDPEHFRSLVGKFLYLNLTRPDISFAVQQLSQFMSKPRTPHWHAALHLLRYLRSTADLGLFFPSTGSLSLLAYCDADWGACMFSRKSLTGYCIFLGGSLISWKTKKQKTTSKSSAESEYRSMSQTTSEVVWIAGVLEDLFVSVPKPIPLFCDNKAAHYIAQNPVFHERTKHLEIDCHYVRDHVANGFLRTSFVPSYTKQP